MLPKLTLGPVSSAPEGSSVQASHAIGYPLRNAPRTVVSPLARSLDNPVRFPSPRSLAMLSPTAPNATVAAFGA